jgi:hypothetical protein
MADKKIIEKENVKENNPNDDEEILKNNEDADALPVKDEEPAGSKSENEKKQGSETLGIP